MEHFYLPGDEMEKRIEPAHTACELKAQDIQLMPLTDMIGFMEEHKMSGALVGIYLLIPEKPAEKRKGGAFLGSSQEPDGPYAGGRVFSGRPADPVDRPDQRGQQHKGDQAVARSKYPGSVQLPPLGGKGGCTCFGRNFSRPDDGQQRVAGRCVMEPWKMEGKVCQGQQKGQQGAHQ